MGRFVDRYSDIIEPLTRLTKKTTEWHWGDDQEQAFMTLKSEITSDKILAHYNPDALPEIYTDGSPIGVSAILVQQGKPVT